jgi:hypothetical protein
MFYVSYNGKMAVYDELEIMWKETVIICLKPEGIGSSIKVLEQRNCKYIKVGHNYFLLILIESQVLLF